MNIRNPAVAGLFYPNDPGRLRQTVTSLMAQATVRRSDRPSNPLKGIIVPHAGYVYSGPVAASAYKLLEPLADRIRRVVLLGPSHRVAFRGIATSSCDGFRTPLGVVKLDQDAGARISGLPGVCQRDDAHAFEHSLEVHLPFLQLLLGENFSLLPLVVGDADPSQVAAVLSTLWGGEETLIVISSDLSHYLPYGVAVRQDAITSKCIETLSPTLTGDMACGCRPLNGLLRLAADRGLHIQALDVRNSGDTAGNKDQVVGYGAYALTR